MKTDRRILVLGGRGFVGRHAVAALERAGASVTIGTRRPRSGEEERYVLHEAPDAADWQDAANRYDVILNCIGILRQRFGESYDAVHHVAPTAIARACRDSRTRFVHVSALGLRADARSRFLTSKVKGERAIEETGGDWYVARLSLLDGTGGYGAAWLRGVSRLPLFVVPTSAKGGIAALTAEDAGEALARICLEDDATLAGFPSRILEIGGETPYGFEEYIRGLRVRYRGGRALCIRIPGLLARLGAHICDLFHFSPFSFGHWELLCRDNVPARPDLRRLLGRAPTRVIE